MSVVTLVQQRSRDSDIPIFCWSSEGVRGQTYSEIVDGLYALFSLQSQPLVKNQELFGIEHNPDEAVRRLYDRAKEEISRLGSNYLLYDQTKWRDTFINHSHLYS